MTKDERLTLELLAEEMAYLATDGDTIFNIETGKGIALIKVVARFNHVRLTLWKMIRTHKQAEKKGELSDSK